MSSFSKIQAALAAATNEVTVAAANLNFDFTLIKCEAPEEFHPLGSVLSQRRKDDAEYGSTHITARRLGALFDGFLPSTPNLLRAYGSRVSAIAQACRQNNTPEPDNSMFAAHAGIDGTSIWAAATSSPTALHVQLLACMLARVWPASEATSIWVELVKERRKEIEEKWAQNHAIPYASLTAATQSQISRPSLAEWDASARSWLRTADRVKVKHQDQLMILIANVNVPINEDMVVYQSVITAWKSALDSIEKLMSGMPQASNYGPCLLALSSWHLYPDIILMGPTVVSHKFEDPLIQPGGTLTLGLARPGGDAIRGVFWSLSLAHLNFYGRRPVEREAVLSLQSQRLSFQQFTIAVFGAFLAHWGVSGATAEAPARFFVNLRESIQTTSNAELGKYCAKVSSDGARKIDLLARAAAAFIDARRFEDDLNLKLIALGTKKSPKLLAGRRAANFMGFGEPETLLPLLKGSDERITLLRRVLSDSLPPSADEGTYLIRFFDKAPSPRGQNSRLPRMYWSRGDAAGIATGQPRREALPQGGFSNKPHVRWVPRTLLEANRLCHDIVHELSHEAVLHVGSQQYEFTLEGQHDANDEVLHTYQYVYGAPGYAAIYIDSARASLTRPMRQLTFEDLIWCLEFGLIDMEAMVSFFDRIGDDLSPEGQTLTALSTAHQIYQVLPTATVSTRALNKPLYLTQWASDRSGSRVKQNSAVFDLLKSHREPERQISQNVAFACVAWLEAGADIDPLDLKRVFALAFEDSIYVAMQV